MVIDQLHKDIYAVQQFDKHCKDIILNITNPESLESPNPEPRWSLDDQQLLCYDYQIWIPDTDDLQLRILLNKHDYLLSGHYGQSKTMELVRRDYTWPCVPTFVKDYCKSCTTCTRSKTPRHKPYGNLQQLTIPEKPWNLIFIDFIEHLPSSSGYMSILVVVDRLTKQAIFIPTHDTITSQELAQPFVIHVSSKHEIPSHVTADRGVEFISHFFRSLGNPLNMKFHYTSGYPPH